MNRGKVKIEKNTLRSQLAGTWYTADAVSLKAEIDGYLAMVGDHPQLNPIALILPHAGYRYSGGTAAFGIDQIKGGDYKRIIIIGPTHQYPMRNVVSVPDVTHYQTPLGEVALDLEFINKLKKLPFVITNMAVHQEEHSVQIELPLIQSVLKDFEIVPIVCGQLDLETAQKIGKTLREMVDAETLVVISSDFTHYGERFGYVPFKDVVLGVPAQSPEQTQNAVSENIKKLDLGAYHFIEQKDVAGFMDYVEKSGATICGRNPIEILLAMLPGNAKAHLLHYDTSGAMTEDYENSVSYLSVAFSGEWGDADSQETIMRGRGEGTPAPEETGKGEENSGAYLSDSDKQSLLQLARASLMYYLENKTQGTPEELGFEITKGMSQTMGAFVTLHKDGRLRGCIGEIVPRRELYKAVIEHAVNAGFNDYRFTPVKANEVADLDFEISALSPPHKVESYRDIVIGKHGVVLHKNGASAVFLPQVAPEQGWGVEETLTQLALKAGLRADDWRKGATFEVFEAIVF